MFTEFMYIALVLCLLLGACSEVGLVYGMSFDTLLGAATIQYILKIWTGLACITTRCVPKVRDNAFNMPSMCRLSGVYVAS